MISRFSDVVRIGYISWPTNIFGLPNLDFMRTFTWDKKLESWVKESGILGGGGKEPTIVTPKTYRIRFREAMERYFLMVPDFWASVGQSTIGQQHHHQ